MPRKQPKPEDSAPRSRTVQVPDFMRADAGKGLEETKPEDIAWVGEQFLVGDADRERDKRVDAIARDIFSPRNALRLILDEIIRHNPITDRKWGNEARLETALTALLGSDPQTAQQAGDGGASAPRKSDKGRGGRKELADEGFLRVMAREYLRDLFKPSDQVRTITALCWDAIYEVMPNWQSMSPQQLDTVRSRLFRKFGDREARDRIMIEYTGAADYKAKRYIDLASKVLPYLAALGLVAPRSSPMDKTEQ